MLPDPSPASEHQRIIASLTAANEQYQEHRRLRGQHAKTARENGLTNQEIADAYGITEAAVRALVKRAGDK